MSSSTTKSETDYSLHSETKAEFTAPKLPYFPPQPKSYQPKIGLIGCGGITQTHLKAYKEYGHEVVAFCDASEERARQRAEEFYPEGTICTKVEGILSRSDIDVVDIATHPQERVPLIRDALNAGKHVLSQKPFVLDLDTGEELADLADKVGRKLAINQNGRWAPHFSYMREAVNAGVIGEIISSHLQVHWDHTWVLGTPFEDIHDLVLYDFAIHWFDITANFWGNREAKRVFATKTAARGQKMAPPMLAQCLIEYEEGQASLIFDAHVKYGAEDHSYVAGTEGTLVSTGPDLGRQSVTLSTEEGKAVPDLQGAWFPHGFAGTMGELLCAIEEDRQPRNNARDNLKSLALCFAAIASSVDGLPKVPGEVRRLPEGSVPKFTAKSR